VDPNEIPMRVRGLVDDARAWVQHEVYDFDEIGVRFHHRLVAIHPFPNGNGRHSRAAASLLAGALGRAPFSWGAQTYGETGELRNAYLRALRAADRDNIEMLVAFARS
jgi:Fic-DOC domain mobile mystery protein B